MVVYVSCAYPVRIVYLWCTHLVRMVYVSRTSRRDWALLAPCERWALPRPRECRLAGYGKESVARLAARLSFFDGQGEQVAVGGEIEDNVAAVGFDGVEQGRFVEPVTGHDTGLGLDQEADGVEVAEAGGMDERSAAVGIHWVNMGAVLEQAGDALAVLAVQGSSGAAEEFEKGRQAVGGGAVDVGTLGDGGFEQGQISLLDGLEELLVGLGGRLGWRWSFGTRGGPNRRQSEQCQNTHSPAFQPGPFGK